MSWTGPAYVAALVLLLRANSTLAALTPKLIIVGYEPGVDDATTDLLAIGMRVADTQVYAVSGPPMASDEEVTIECRIQVSRPGAGSVPADAAAVQAQLILDEIHQQVRDASPAIGVQTVNDKVAERDYRPFPASASDGTPMRVCQVDFKIQYKARIA